MKKKLLLLYMLLGSCLTPVYGNALPPVHITGVVVGFNTVKVHFDPVEGAKDYRIYELQRPDVVKYAGLQHPYDARLFNPPGNLPSIPATMIEWNGLVPHRPTVLVVEAVDALGPFPKYNLYNADNRDLFPDPKVMRMLGSNAGLTPGAGGISINGQGDYRNVPHAVARSQPFTVTATGEACIPSTNNAGQTFFDACEAMTLSPGHMDGAGSLLSYTMKTSAGNLFDVGFKDCDNKNSRIMVEHRHLMTIVFDGPTPAPGRAIKHNNHSLIFFSPKKTFSIAGDKILHIVTIVDSHVDGRRWIGVSLSPADDPLVDWYGNKAINKSGSAAFFEVFNNKFNLSEWNGSQRHSIYGSQFQAPDWGHRATANGIALDNRSRYDLFVSTRHIRIFEDGKLVGDKDWPVTLPFQNVKAYFVHYLYHTGNEIDEVRHNTPYETFWRDLAPYSDERHWGVTGCEVLPADTSWKSLADNVKMPGVTPPHFVNRDEVTAGRPQQSMPMRM